MWVVKLGGSLLSGGWLRSWTEVLAQTRQSVVVVPGGGAFADQVRAAQRRWRLDNPTAHRMAILAMEQMAYLLCAVEPRLCRLVDAGARQHCPKPPPRAEVWFPAASLLGDETIPRSWDVTSDSLAAILARRLRAQGLVLVKSAPLDGIRCGVLALQAAGLVDGAFDRFGADCGCPVWLLGRESSANLSRLWQGQGDAALAVEFASAQGPCST